MQLDARKGNRRRKEQQDDAKVQTANSAQFAGAERHGVLAHPAAAIEPTREPIDDTITSVVEDICSFPVTITATIVGTETTFYDQNGEVTRQQIHVVAQDVFSTDSASLTGLPFTFNIQVLFEDGEVTHIYASGLVERVPLPDGTVFLSAGRLDFAAHPESDFRIVPDVGRSGDVAAYCAWRIAGRA